MAASTSTIKLGVGLLCRNARPITARTFAKSPEHLFRSFSSESYSLLRSAQVHTSLGKRAWTEGQIRGISFTKNQHAFAPSGISRSAATTSIPYPSGSTAIPYPSENTSSHSDSSSRSKFETDDLPALTSPALATFLKGCAGLVFFIVVVGGVTRLTESGLSITEWEPIKGILPPIGEAQWAVEWEKYRVTPEGVMMNSQLDLPEFKKIFYMEWAHRIAGRLLGVGFIIPTAYFLYKRRLTSPNRLKFLLLSLGIGFQGFLGWYMVKSGLSEEILTTPGAVPRVSQYRLAAHLSAALVLYAGMVATAVGINGDAKFAKSGEAGLGVRKGFWEVKEVRRFARWSKVVTALVLFTAASGAFVAGLDAGLIYNEFPMMGENIIPPTDELMDPRYAKKADGSDKWWRNVFENPTTVQFDHRALATTTFLSVLSLPFLATRPALRRHLPPRAITYAKYAMGAALLQVSLGISTLLYLVPVPLAAAHQAGSVVLLTTMLALVGSLRRPSGVARRHWKVLEQGLRVRKA